MAISDSMPERRNLVVTSMAFIAFYASGGYVADHTLRLSLVNVSVRNPEVLGIMAWMMLYWFALRFWQATKSQFYKEFYEELRGAKISSWLAKYARAEADRKGGKKPQLISGFESIDVYGLTKEGAIWVVNCGFIQIQEGNPVQRHTEKVQVNGPRLWAFVVFALLKHAITNNAAANFAFPYMVFIAAATSPYWGRFLWC